MISIFKAFLQRRRLGEIFGTSISPEAMRQLFSSNASLLAPTIHTIDFAFVAITAPDVSSYSERVAMAGNIAAQHGGVVNSNVPVFIVTFGIVPPTRPGDCAQFVDSLRPHLGDSVAIVYGSIEASVGSFGNRDRLEFGFWWPGAHDALRLLARLSPGEIHEFPNELSSGTGSSAGNET